MLLKQISQKIKKAINFLIVAIGSLAVFIAVMAAAYEFTPNKDAPPDPLRTVWLAFRADPRTIAQGVLTNIAGFISGDTKETATSPAIVTKPKQQPAIKPQTPPTQKDSAPAPPPQSKPAPTRRPVTATAPVVNPAVNPAAVPTVNPANGPVFLRDQYPLGIRLINETRRQHGLRALEPHPVLMELAEKKAADLLAFGYQAHYSPRLGHPDEMVNPHISPDPAWIGENLVRSSSYTTMEDIFRFPTAQDSHDSFMRSPLHRQAVLALNATHVGYAIIAGRVNVAGQPDFTVGEYLTITVQLFMVEARTDIHSIRLELVGTPTITPDKPTTVTVRAHAEYTGIKPRFSRSVTLISSDPWQLDLRPTDRQHGFIHPGETFTATLQALPPGSQRVTHFIKIDTFEMSPEHAARKSGVLSFDVSVELGKVFITSEWVDANSKKHYDIIQ